MFLERLEVLGRVLQACSYTSKDKAIEGSKALEMAHFLLGQVKQVRGIIYVIGNGGSSGIASHFCTDLLRTLELPAATFSDSNILTCFANDFGYENVYKLPLSRNLRGEDILVAISSSGRSANILEAVKLAQEKKIPIITLSGFAIDNPLRQMGDLNFWIDSSDYGLVEMGHFFLLHTLIDTYQTCQSQLKNQKIEI